MPIYEYKCDKCGAKYESLQTSYASKEYCEEVNSNCSGHGHLTRLISSFAVNSSSGSESSCGMGECCMPSSGHVHSSGCGCGNSSSSCVGESMRQKYGLD